MNIINLSSYRLSDEERILLSKGLSFCPNSNLDTLEVIKDLNLFARKLLLKSMYSKNRVKSETPDAQHEKDLDVLLSLLEEQDSPNLIDSINLDSLLQEQLTVETPPPRAKKLKNKSDKFPPLSSNPNLMSFVSLVTSEIKKLKIHKKAGNLSPPELLALDN